MLKCKRRCFDKFTFLLLRQLRAALAKDVEVASEVEVQYIEPRENNTFFAHFKIISNGTKEEDLEDILESFAGGLNETTGSVAAYVGLK